MTQSGNGHGKYEPSAEYEQVEPGQWVKFDEEGVEVVYDITEELDEDGDDETEN